MSVLEALIGPIAAIIDKVIPDKEARDRAKLELLRLQGSQELGVLQAQLSAIVAEANSADPWTSRGAAGAISGGMGAYLQALPEPLYVLFGTGYLGYTAARQWGKFSGTDK